MIALRFHLHAPDSGFADTQPLSDAAHARRNTLKFFHCDCSAAPLVRIVRPAWMRLLPLFRLYRCLDCGARVLRVRRPTQTVYGARYLPARPLRVAATPDRCSASVLHGVYKRTLSAAASEEHPQEGRRRLR